MLYVFQVDTGTMVMFDMKIALETVSCLQSQIAGTCKIPEDKQVLLISGGDSLNPEARVCTYNAGTDTNPIFLFNKVAIECSAPPHITEPVSDRNLTEDIESCMNMPPNYGTVVARTEIAHKCFNMAVNLIQICEQLVHDQHLQQQSWAAVVANLDDNTSAFRTRSDIFIRKFDSFLVSRSENIHLLQNFSQDLNLLSRIPMLSTLIEKCLDTEASESVISHQDLTLLQWISSKDNHSSLEQVADQCHRGFDQFDSKTFDGLRADIKNALETVDNTNMKEIKGLEERLCGLEQMMFKAKSIVNEQKDLAQAFLQNQKRASNLRDRSVLPDLCASHQKQLLVMQQNHKVLTDIKQRCIRAKDELTQNLHTRLRWIMYVQKTIYDVDNKLVIYHENLKRLRRHLDIIYQIHLAPEIYLAAVVEVVRRKAFSRSFMQWADNLATQSVSLYQQEILRRRSFNDQLIPHFLSNLFPGMEDYPPKFGTEIPERFDLNLPEISESDIDELKKSLPEFTSSLQVPSPIKMPSTCDDKKQVKERTAAATPSCPVSVQSLKRREMSDNEKGSKVCDTETEFYMSTSDVPTWALGTSPPEPAPDTHAEHATLFHRNIRLRRISTDGNENIEVDDRVSESAQKAGADRLSCSLSSPSTGVTSSDCEPHASPELGEFLTADFYIDESMPSSYTESNGNSPRVLIPGTSANDPDKRIVGECICTGNVNKDGKELNTLSDTRVNRFLAQNVDPTSDVTDLRIENSETSSLLRTTRQMFLLRLEREEKLRLNLKRDLAELKELVVDNTKKSSSEVESTINHVGDVISNLQESIQNEREEVTKQMAIKCENEMKAVVRELQTKIDSKDDEITVLKRQMEAALWEKEKLLESLKVEMDDKVNKVKEDCSIEKDNLSKNLILEHELELDSLRHEMNRAIGLKDDEMARHKQVTEQQMKNLEESLSKLNSEMNIEGERLKQKIDFLTNQHRAEIEAMEKQCEDKLKKQTTEMQDDSSIQAQSSKEVKLEKELQKMFQIERERLKVDLLAKAKAEKEEALVALREKLVVDHKNDMESLRSRFRLAVHSTSVMERSPSDPSLEKIENVKSMIDVSQREKELDVLRSQLNDEKIAYAEDLLKSATERHEKEIKELSSRSEKEKSDAITVVRATMTAEKQVIFNKAVSQVTAQKDNTIKELLQKIQDLSNKSNVSNTQNTTFVIDANMIESTAGATNVGTKPKSSQSTMMASISASGIIPSSLDHQKTFAGEPLLQLKREELDAMHKRLMNLSVCSSTQSLIKCDKISVLSCNVGDVVLLFFDEKHNSYAVFLLCPVLHFLYTDSHDSIFPSASSDERRQSWALAVVVDKEYCQAKKPQNRFRVAVGTRFYRVKAKLWEKEIAYRIENIKKLIDASSLQ